MNAESPYMFYLDLAVGRSVTSDDPAFSVAFGRRSKVVYRDTLNEIVLGASFDGPIIDTDGLTRQVLSLPVLGGFDTYALLVLQRIGAAAAWRSQGTVFRGILGDRLARCLGGGHTVSRQGSVAGSIGTSMVGSVVGSGSSFADVRVRPAHVRVRPWVPSSTCLLRLAVPVPSGGVPA
jgi:hypothetical protein